MQRINTLQYHNKNTSRKRSEVLSAEYSSKMRNIYSAYRQQHYSNCQIDRARTPAGKASFDTVKKGGITGGPQKKVSGGVPGLSFDRMDHI